MASDPRPGRPMTAEQLAVLADDIADMADDFVRARDAKSLRTMATNLAGMIRRHVPASQESDAALVPRLNVLREWLTTWVDTACGCAGCRRDIKDFLDADAENGLAARVREGA